MFFEQARFAKLPIVTYVFTGRVRCAQRHAENHAAIAVALAASLEPGNLSPAQARRRGPFHSSSFVTHII